METCMHRRLDFQRTPLISLCNLERVGPGLRIWIILGPSPKKLQIWPRIPKGSYCPADNPGVPGADPSRWVPDCRGPSSISGRSHLEFCIPGSPVVGLVASAALGSIRSPAFQDPSPHRPSWDGWLARATLPYARPCSQPTPPGHIGV